MYGYDIETKAQASQMESVLLRLRRLQIKLVITGDESWVYGYNIETKAQQSQWKRPEEPRPKKARQLLLTVFFGCNGVGHHEFMPKGCAVNKE